MSALSGGLVDALGRVTTTMETASVNQKTISMQMKQFSEAAKKKQGEAIVLQNLFSDMMRNQENIQGGAAHLHKQLSLRPEIEL